MNGVPMRYQVGSMIVEQLSNGKFAIARVGEDGWIDVGIFLSASEMNSLMHIFVEMWKETDQYKEELKERK
jgi:hypothetical protein